jgi:hypothetical protein
MLVVPCVYLLGFRSRTYKLDATSKVEEGILDRILADRSPRAGQLAIATIVQTPTFGRLVRRQETIHLDESATRRSDPAQSPHRRLLGQGRVLEGLKSPGFAEPYRTYLGIRSKTKEDPLLADISRRIRQ